MTQALEIQEQKNQQLSATLTSVLTALILLALFLWIIPYTNVDALLKEEKEEIFEIVGGGMDFGDNTNGSGDVNNFHEATETPRDAPPAASATDPEPPAPAPKTTSAPVVQEELVSSQEEEVVKAPPPAPKPTSKVTPKEPVTVPTPKKKAEPKLRKKTAPHNRTNTNSTFSTGGGSNHGDGKGIGNRGTPDSKILNPNGLFSFGNGSGSGAGDGEGGLNGRRLLYHINPKYETQEEGKIKFKLSVSPDGDVVGIKAIGYSGQLKLKRATEECLRKWKFSPNSSRTNQEIFITFTFKLK